MPTGTDYKYPVEPCNEHIVRKVKYNRICMTRQQEQITSTQKNQEE